MGCNSNVNLNEIAERMDYSLDYLSSGSPIFQVKNLYMFTSDSIELAHSVEEEKINKLVDLCSGSGVIGLEIAGIKQVDNLILVEMQEDLARASRLSVDYFLNDTCVDVINDNLFNLSNYIDADSVDVVVCNPPYFKKGSGFLCENKSRAMARHELYLTLEGIIREVERLLKSGGKFYLIHVRSREKEIDELFKKYGLTIISKKVLEGKLERLILVAQKK